MLKTRRNEREKRREGRRGSPSPSSSSSSTISQSPSKSNPSGSPYCVLDADWSFSSRDTIDFTCIILLPLICVVRFFLEFWYRFSLWGRSILCIFGSSARNYVKTRTRHEQNFIARNGSHPNKFSGTIWNEKNDLYSILRHCQTERTISSFRRTYFFWHAQSF